VARFEALYRQWLVRLDQARAVRLAAELAGGRHLLDIGCGDALLVCEARRLGLEAFGVDRPEAPLWRGCDPCWRTSGDVEHLEQPPEQWDVISLFHVAEHLRAPVELFAKVRRWLRPRGVFVLQVPNAEAVQAAVFGARWYGYDVPRHLVHWSRSTLRRALAGAGFEVLRERHMSWRDSGPFWAGSLCPGLDPLIERERSLAGGPRPAAVTLLRRLAYLALVWSTTPLSLAEAALGRGATVTVLARRRDQG
jgi:SAM-dependent methyltransferase